MAFSSHLAQQSAGPRFKGQWQQRQRHAETVAESNSATWNDRRLGNNIEYRVKPRIFKHPRLDRKESATRNDGFESYNNTIQITGARCNIASIIGLCRVTNNWRYLYQVSKVTWPAHLRPLWFSRLGAATTTTRIIFPLTYRPKNAPWCRIPLFMALLSFHFPSFNLSRSIFHNFLKIKM